MRDLWTGAGGVPPRPQRGVLGDDGRGALARRVRLGVACDRGDRTQGGHGMTAIRLRPATGADREFCYQLHMAAMGEYVAAVWGWDERVQRGFHARAFSPGRWQIITADGADAGMLDVGYRRGEIYLARIEIHPDYQGRGIGRRLISALADEARQQ